MSRVPRWLLLVVLGSVATHVPARAEDAPAPPPATTSSEAEGPSPLRWPGERRSDLVVPAGVWGRVTERLGLGGGALGYTADQMAHYGRDARILRPVALLFRDVRSVPRLAGKLSDDLLAAAKDPAELVRLAYGLTDAVAARNFPRPKAGEWGVDWIREARPPAEALDKTLARLADLAGVAATPVPADARKAFLALPEPVQRLVVRFLVGSAEALPWIRAAFDERFLVEAVGGRGPQDLSPTRLYRLASRPWVDEDASKSPLLSRAAFEALGRVDRDYLALASVVYLIHVTAALEEWRAARGSVDLAKAEGGGLWIDTAIGAVRVFGPGADKVDAGPGASLLTLDLGGDDVYSGRLAVPSYPVAPVSALVDLGGNDVYDGGNLPCSLGCGLFGIGALFDLAGDDRYTVASSGLGCAWYGTGVLDDEGGNDTYVVKDRWAQGAAHVGVGLLVDLAGNDRYECAQQAQGLGATYGAGVLLDVAGDDAYVARDDGNREKIYNDQSVAMAQGCGYGRRADLGDGHSLAGGFGVLVDGAGNDRYHAQCWAQGCGYWWAAGILEDRGGDDVYENGKYSLGAAAHFAVGCQVDLAGDDQYNQGVATAVNQYQGHARDGSIGVSIDGDGNDRYLLRNHCGGSADLCSVALFWDRRGDDVYDVRWNDLGPANGWNETPPLGSTTRGEAPGTFRDEIGTWGVFLDTGGQDTYRWEGEARQPARDDAWWLRRLGGASAGLGLDVEAYPAATRPEGPAAPTSPPK